MSETTATPVVPEAPVAPQVEVKAPPEDPKPTPPWGTAEDFNPEKAWELITKLREQKNDPAVAKELETLRADKATREDAERSDAEKAEARVKAAEDKATETAAELVRKTAAWKHNLSPEDAEALEGIPADRVEALAERLAGKAVPTPKAPSPAGQGNVGEPVAGGEKPLSEAEVKQMYSEKRYEEIEAARVAGRLTGVLGPTP